jgi:hypothetical protein
MQTAVQSVSATHEVNLLTNGYFQLAATLNIRWPVIQRHGCFCEKSKALHLSPGRK